MAWSASHSERSGSSSDYPRVESKAAFDTVDARRDSQRFDGIAESKGERRVERFSKDSQYLNQGQGLSSDSQPLRKLQSKRVGFVDDQGARSFGEGSYEGSLQSEGHALRRAQSNRVGWGEEQGARRFGEGSFYGSLQSEGEEDTEIGYRPHQGGRVDYSNIVELINDQKRYFPIIFQELVEHDAKKGNWTLIVFPSDKEGVYRSVRDRTDATELLDYYYYRDDGMLWDAILTQIVELCLGETRRKLSDVFPNEEDIDSINRFVHYWKLIFETNNVPFPYWFISKVGMFEFLLMADKLSKPSSARRAIQATQRRAEQSRGRLDLEGEGTFSSTRESPYVRRADIVGTPLRRPSGSPPPPRDDDRQAAEKEESDVKAAQKASLELQRSATNSNGSRPPVAPIRPVPAAPPIRQAGNVIFRVVESEEEEVAPQPKKSSYFPSWLTSKRSGGLRKTRRKRRKAVNRMRTRQILNHLY